MTAKRRAAWNEGSLQPRPEPAATRGRHSAARLTMESSEAAFGFTPAGRDASIVMSGLPATDAIEAASFGAISSSSRAWSSEKAPRVVA